MSKCEMKQIKGRGDATPNEIFKEIAKIEKKRKTRFSSYKNKMVALSLGQLATSDQ
jgi:hypothetical protein